MTPNSSGPSIIWSEGAELAPARGGAASGIVGDALILAGGTYWLNDRKQWLAETAIYDLSGKRWVQAAALPRPLAYCTGAVWRDQFLCLGGGGPEGADRAVRKLQKKDGKWQWEMLIDLPRWVVSGGAQVIGDQLYVIGGAEHPDRLATASPTVFSFDLAGSSQKWTARAPIPESGRVLFASTVCGGRILIFGGMAFGAGDTRINLSSAWEYDPVGDKWKRLADLPITLRALSAVAWQDRYVFLPGGYSVAPVTGITGGTGGAPEARFDNRVWRYDRLSDSYQEMAPLPHGLCDIAFHLHGRTLYGAGGEPGPKQRAPWTLIGKIEPGAQDG